ncbi:MAG TPA: CBS domain-containing protein, partial [Candidatus Limnocylindrales bacterium]|nr:CBS domain-containing protein [Candidatus Limnocylindrales bacterium]
MKTTDLMVADVMALDPITVGMDAPIEDAVALLRAYGISGLPVTDATGSVVGVISQTDLVATMNVPVGRLIRSGSSGLRVGELMTSPAITIPMTAPLGEAARLMREARILRIVAVDD